MIMRAKSKDKLVGILLGRASTPEKARSISRFFNACPYCALSTSTGTTVISVFSLPMEHRWWLDSIAAHPKNTVGIEEAEVFYTARVAAQSPWSAGEIKATADKPPCGADCVGCPAYKKKCPGCIATKYYTL